MSSFFRRLGEQVLNKVGELIGRLENIGLDEILPTPRWHVARVDGQLLRGPQPFSSRWNELAQLGIRAVVSLQSEEPSEAAIAKRFGMVTLRLPITDNTNPTLLQVRAFLDFVTTPANAPVFVHCRAGRGRTGVMVGCYRMAVNGWPLSSALAEARAMGMRIPAQAAFLADFAAALEQGQIPAYWRRKRAG